MLIRSFVCIFHNKEFPMPLSFWKDVAKLRWLEVSLNSVLEHPGQCGVLGRT